MATTTVFTFLRALKTSLEGRAGLSGVTVATASLGRDTPKEAIIFHSIVTDEEYLAMGKSKKEALHIEGAIWINKPGAGETVIQDAQDRAVAIFGELEAELQDTTAQSSELDAAITNWHVDQGPNDQGRYCQWNFTIDVLATKG